MNGVPEKWCPGNIYLRGRSASGVQAPNVSLINRHTVIIGWLGPVGGRQPPPATASTEQQKNVLMFHLLQTQIQRFCQLYLCRVTESTRNIQVVSGADNLVCPRLITICPPPSAHRHHTLNKNILESVSLLPSATHAPVSSCGVNDVTTCVSATSPRGPR